MSEEANARVVWSAFEAFQRGDIPGVMALLDPAIAVEFYGPPDVPFAGRYVGHAGFQDYLGRVTGAVEFVEFAPRESIAQGDQVIVLGSSRVRARASGREARFEWATAFTLAGGKVVRYRVYEDTAALLAALAP